MFAFHRINRGRQSSWSRCWVSCSIISEVGGSAEGRQRYNRGFEYGSCQKRLLHCCIRTPDYPMKCLFSQGSILSGQILVVLRQFCPDFWGPKALPICPDCGSLMGAKFLAPCGAWSLNNWSQQFYLVPLHYREHFLRCVAYQSAVSCFNEMFRRNAKKCHFRGF